MNQFNPKFIFIWYISLLSIQIAYCQSSSSQVWTSTTTPSSWQSTTTSWQTTTTPFFGCVRPQRNTTVYGNAYASFRNVDSSFCCELCQKVPDCALSTWVPPSFSSQVAVCNLFNNFTQIIYDINSKTVTLFPSSIPFKCKSEENRLFYELDWTEIDNIYTKETCIEVCTFDNMCKSWMFVKDTSSCLTSTMSYENTKWTTYSGAITGTCSLSF